MCFPWAQSKCTHPLHSSGLCCLVCFGGVSVYNLSCLSHLALLGGLGWLEKCHGSSVPYCSSHRPPKGTAQGRRLASPRLGLVPCIILAQVLCAGHSRVATKQQRSSHSEAEDSPILYNSGSAPMSLSFVSCCFPPKPSLTLHQVGPRGGTELRCQ